MDNYFFEATLTIYVELSEADVELLLHAAANHYDFKVQASTIVGGFLFGIHNRHRFAKEQGKEDKIADFSESQLNLLMKALEMSYQKDVIRLRHRLFKLFRQLQEQTIQINKTLMDLKY